MGGRMRGHDIREDLATACRVLARYRLIDLWGHLSLRIPRSEAFLVTPRFGARVVPRTLRAEDLLVVGLDGRVIDGEGDLPRQFEAALAAYRSAPEIGSLVFYSPVAAMAAGIARRPLRPLTHMESFLAYGQAIWEEPALGEGDAAPALGRRLATATAVQQPGLGAWVSGGDLLRALIAAHHWEYLAQANLAALGRPEGLDCREEDSRKLWAQFAGWDHYWEFFREQDPGPQPHPEGGAAPEDAEEQIRRRVALACRALWERDTLVDCLEHVSHRLPGENRMIISGSRRFGSMTPEDMCVLDLDANWLSGPRPPGFKWFHAQMLRERRDVEAIVHTHDLHGRVHALSPLPLGPTCRVGLAPALRETPVYPRCDLVVDAEIRRDVLDLLGSGQVVHEACHGTDFAAETLEEAVADAIGREQFLAIDTLARRFGAPQPMAVDAETIRAAEASAADWWAFHLAEIGAPRTPTPLF
jgi:L-fuculose-phosphate aldolase